MRRTYDDGLRLSTQNLVKSVAALLFNGFMQFSKKDLKAEGFSGFRAMTDLDINRVPQGPGLFTISAPADFEPRFLKTSVAGTFKKRNPTLSKEELAAEWVPGATLLYVGKAGPGSQGNRGLRRQIKEFLDFGRAKPPGHWDGRLIWQLLDTEDLVFAWKELPAEHLGATEAAYHAAFVEHHGRLPFANLTQAR